MFCILCEYIFFVTEKKNTLVRCLSWGVTPLLSVGDYTMLLQLVLYYSLLM